MARTLEFDYAHSSITFSVRHMVVAKVHGRFRRWSGRLDWDDDVERASVSVEIDAASIDTQEEKRDAHLRSPDFFDVAAHPTLGFRSTRVERVDGERLRVVGELTIRGVTREVALDVEHGRGKDPWGNERVAFSGRGAISRGEFGLKWNQALEAGGVLVGDKVELTLDVQAVVKAAERAA